MKKLNKLLLSVFTLVCSGCATFSDDCNESMCCFRDKCRGYYAWYQWKPVYSGMDCQSDFGAGFRAGYAAMATNGKATPPILPPQSYWRPWYQNEYGHQQMQSWYDGYAHGALVAEQDGVNQWSHIRTNPAAVPQRYPAGNQTTNGYGTANPAPAIPPRTEEGPAFDDQQPPQVPELPPSNNE